MSKRQGKINIIFLVAGLNVGGTETQLLELIKQLDPALYLWRIICFKGATDKLLPGFEHYWGDQIIEWDLGAHGKLNRIFIAINRLYKYCRRHDIQIVQSFFAYENLINTLLGLLRPQTINIISKRNLSPNIRWLSRLMDMLACRRAELVLANSGAVKKRIIELTRIADDRIKVIYNGVDSKRFYPPIESEKKQAKYALGLRRGDFVVGIVANMSAEKRHLVYLDALRRLKNNGVNNILGLLVGDGPLRRELEEYCRTNGISGVRFLGQINNPIAAMRAFDVGVLTSASEGFSNVILEYMAMGIPVIATNVGGNVDAIEQGKTGYLVDTGDSQKIVEYIKLLNNDKEKLKEISFLARKRAENLFSIRRMVDSYKELYESYMESI